MKYLLICLLFISCQKELESPCGKVVSKQSMSIHGNFIDVDFGACILRFKVDLKTYTSVEVGGEYCRGND